MTAHDDSNEHVGGQIWQYGIIRYVHATQLLDINLDGGEEVRCIPTFEVQRASDAAAGGSA